MANQIFMRVNEVAEELGISIPFAYRIIRQMNEELAKTGCITIAGRIDRKFFHEKFYGTRSETERLTIRSQPPKWMVEKKQDGSKKV